MVNMEETFTSKTYRFMTTLRCYLANGEITTLDSYEVAVDAPDLESARSYIQSVATEMVGDAGSRLLDAPLEELEVVRATRI